MVFSLGGIKVQGFYMDTINKKICFKCKIEWPLIYFYKHSQMRDGHLNKCKKCAKKDALDYRHQNIERIRVYDRERSKAPNAVKRRTQATKEWRKKNPEKYKAHNVLNNAVRGKKISKQPCCICGSEKTEAHHEDYSKPLNVIWVCSLHHHDLHK